MRFRRRVLTVQCLQDFEIVRAGSATFVFRIRDKGQELGLWGGGKVPDYHKVGTSQVFA